jgi:hypothetical protein
MVASATLYSKARYAECHADKYSQNTYRYAEFQ